MIIQTEVRHVAICCVFSPPPSIGCPILSCCPGHDGGKWRARCEFRTFPDLIQSPAGIRQTVVNVTLRAVSFKAQRKLSQDDFAAYMAEQAATMSLEDSSHTHKIAAKWLPKNYPSALSMLVFEEACVWNKQVHYDQCIHCNFVYRCEDKYRLDDKESQACKCGAPRIKPHIRTYIYQPLSGHMRNTYSVPNLAHSMSMWYERRPTDPNKVTDIMDVADPFGHNPSLPPSFKNDTRHFRIQFSQDPFMPFVDDSFYSCAPSLVYILNLPPWARQKMFLAHVLGIGPGSRKRDVAPLPAGIKKTHRHKFEIFADELNYLDTYGTRVVDSRTGVPFLCRARLVNCVSDFRGMEDLVGISGSPSTNGCLSCWIRGQKVGGKMLYCGHRTFLGAEDKLRAVLRDMHPEILRPLSDSPKDVARKTRRRRLQDTPPHLRAFYELASLCKKAFRPLPLVEGEKGVTQLGEREAQWQWCQPLHLLVCLYLNINLSQHLSCLPLRFRHSSVQFMSGFFHATVLDTCPRAGGPPLDLDLSHMPLAKVFGS